MDRKKVLMQDEGLMPANFWHSRFNETDLRHVTQFSFYHFKRLPNTFQICEGS